jgi:hypothetical protein
VHDISWNVQSKKYTKTKMTVQNLHKIADRLGVKWDGDKDFMKWTYDLTGKRHLDDMTEQQLMKIASALENGDRPGKRVKGFWRFTNPDPKMNDDDASKQPHGFGM